METYLKIVLNIQIWQWWLGMTCNMEKKEKKSNSYWDTVQWIEASNGVNDKMDK